MCFPSFPLPEVTLPRYFGAIPGIEPGATFVNRLALRTAGIHLPNQAGISGTPSEGADSIVVSGGYVDDEDHGDYLIYTGQGGQDARGRQVADQDSAVRGNGALVTSYEKQLPVRVTRGANRHSAFAPRAGYEYAGLFLVSDWWMEAGKDGFEVVRYRLERLSADAVVQSLPEDLRRPAGSDPRGRWQPQLWSIGQPANPVIAVTDVESDSKSSGVAARKVDDTNAGAGLAVLLEQQISELEAQLAQIGPVDAVLIRFDAANEALHDPNLRRAAPELRRELLALDTRLTELRWDHEELDATRHPRRPTLRELASIRAQQWLAESAQQDRSAPREQAPAPTRFDPSPQLTGILGSDVFTRQVQRAGRRAPATELVARALQVLIARQGVMPRTQFFSELSLPTGGGEQSLSAIRRITNFDGYEPLRMHDDGETVVLDIPLLLEQFEVS